MKTIKILSAIAGLAGLLSFSQGNDNPCPPLSTLDSDMTQVRNYVPLFANIAHRGTTYWAPEETEMSWRWGREMGADYLEGDLQCSKDGIVLAVHDNSLTRTTDVSEVLSDQLMTVRRIFYRSFRNADGTQHFSDSDIEAQVSADSLLGFQFNVRDYYYAEILMLDAGKWFNSAYPERALQAFASDGTALSKTLSSKSCITYSNGLYVSALQDLIEFAEGSRLKRDSQGIRVLPYRVKPDYQDMTLEQIRERSDAERGTNLDGKHYEADTRYMDFVEYDFANAYIADNADSGNRPGIYLEFKESALQPLDIEARTYSILDKAGWNVITSPSTDKNFYQNGKVNVGNTNGKVILQSFRIEAVLRVEQIFKGKVPMCYLIDDEPPSDWDPEHYFDTPEGATNVINYAIEHKCHIIGPSVGGPPNNYPERHNDWQAELVRDAGMLDHPWSIDNIEQMETSMDAMFTNRSDLTLNWLIDNGLRCKANIPNPFNNTSACSSEPAFYDNSQAPSTVPDPAELLIRLSVPAI